jgi:secreted effector protein SseD
MTTVNGNPLAASTPMQDMGINRTSDTGEGAFSRINEIILLMKKMNIEMRDTLRGFHDDMQQTMFAKQMTSMETKQEAIELTYNAAMTNAVSQMVSGVVSFGGALTGSQLASSATTGLGKAAEGAGSVAAADTSRNAQQAQLLGEFQANAADNFAKNIAATADRAAEASRQLRDATRELVGLYERMANAVQMRAR